MYRAKKPDKRGGGGGGGRPQTHSPKVSNITKRWLNPAYSELADDDDEVETFLVNIAHLSLSQSSQSPGRNSIKSHSRPSSNHHESFVNNPVLLSNVINSPQIVIADILPSADLKGIEADIVNNIEKILHESEEEEEDEEEEVIQSGKHCTKFKSKLSRALSARSIEKMRHISPLSSSHEDVNSNVDLDSFSTLSDASEESFAESYSSEAYSSSSFEEEERAVTPPTYADLFARRSGVESFNWRVPKPARNASDLSQKEAQVITEDDGNHFILTLLSLNEAALKKNYSERFITEHMKECGYVSDDYEPRAVEPLPLTYPSIEAYIHAYLPLMLYDAWAQIVKDYYLKPGDYDTNTDPRLNKRHTLRLDAIETDGRFLTLCLQALAPPSPSPTDFDLFALQNYIVTVRNPQKSGGALVLGIVRSYRKLKQVFSDLPKLDAEHSKVPVEYEISLVNSETNRGLFVADKNVIVRPIHYLGSILRNLQSLLLMSYKLNFEDAFLRPSLPIYLPPNSLNVKRINIRDGSRFNCAQMRAIEVACSAVLGQRSSACRTVMIQGPPGTGKSHTLVGIVKNLFLNHPRPASLRILICAPSNGAIDEIGRRLVRDESEWLQEQSINLVRLGRKEKVHDDMEPYLLDSLVYAQNPWLHSTGVSYKQFRRFQRDILRDSNIILSTLNSCQVSPMNIFRESELANRGLSCVIVDEASQCTEPELLMPMVYPSAKLILIGDHLQLPATVMSQVALAVGYGRSLFERLYRHFEAEPSAKWPVICLNEQYRMRPEIVRFPSSHFYGGKLRTSPTTGLNDVIPVQVAYTICDLFDARESPASMDGSKCNLDEVEFIYQLVLAIVERANVKPNVEENVVKVALEMIAKRKKTKAKRSKSKESDEGGADDEQSQQEEVKTLEAVNVSKKKVPKLAFSIGIITFYRGQKEELIRKFRRCHSWLLDLLDINTVDAFQGQERDIIILSCVRAFDPTKDANSVGFVRSQQRMNVALTRAKSALYVCLNARVFASVAHWKELLQDARQRHRLVRIRSGTLKHNMQPILGLCPRVPITMGPGAPDGYNCADYDVNFPAFGPDLNSRTISFAPMNGRRANARTKCTDYDLHFPAF